MKYPGYWIQISGADLPLSNDNIASVAGLLYLIFSIFSLQSKENFLEGS
jgi:hypothetical protein